MAEEKKHADIPDDEIVAGEIIEEGQPAAAPITRQQLEQVSKELQAAQETAKNYFEGWQRERADFANYKRRIERDQQAMTQTITGEVIRKYLTVLDDLERALKNRPTDASAAAWAEGIDLIQRKLQTILDAEGVKRIQADGADFDPSRHEAISYEDSPGHESGQVIEIIQQGYTLGERVLRPALVRVAR